MNPYHQWYSWTWKEHPEWNGFLAFLCDKHHYTRVFKPKHCCPLVSISHSSGTETIPSDDEIFSYRQQCVSCFVSDTNYAFYDLMKLAFVEFTHDKNLWYSTFRDSFSIELVVDVYTCCFKVDGKKKSICVMLKRNLKWSVPQSIDSDLPDDALYTYFKQCNKVVTLQMSASQTLLKHFDLVKLKKFLPKCFFKKLRTMLHVQSRWDYMDPPFFNGGT